METLGLRNLVAAFLGFRLSKKERCSNWARATLTPQQITYAATDAWASRELYLAMERAGLNPGEDAS
jgi:ribonuclease D